MAIERKFIKEGIRESQIEKFLRNKFEKAGYSHTEIQRTPLGTRIVVYAHKPGLVIGRGGRRVNEITDEVKEKFGLENPLIDVREVESPFLDAKIIAKRIAGALERGIHYKKVCNYYLGRIMEAGAIGVQIEVSGKLTGSQRSRLQKFKDGFIAHSGDYAEKFVDRAYSQAMLRPGTVGVQVKIMLKAPEEFVAERRLRVEEAGDEEKEEAEEREEENEGESEAEKIKRNG